MKTSCLFQKLKLLSNLQVRWNSSKAKFKLKEEIENLITEEKIKPRKHPGVLKNKQIQIPNWLIEAMNQSLDDIKDRSQLYKESVNLSNYLFSRRLPLNPHELKAKYLNLESDMLPDNLDQLSEDEIQDKRKAIKGKIIKKLKEKTFAWKPIEYTTYKSLMYMIARSTAEYAALHNIFNEIATRDPDFNPRTVFDFGSGVGSVLWAANRKWNHIKEYLGVDISNEMNNLNEKFVSHMKFKHAFYRQYLPVSNLKYDLVVSAYTLMELPDTKNRLAAISKLWRKTNKYLVIVEQGSNAGFKLVNEAREFIKHISNKLEKEEPHFIFAPCPHEFTCPRYEEGRTPCNFLVNYIAPPVAAPSQHKQELYSYIVFKKGERTENDNWHRVVRPTIIRSKHAWCRLCTANGKLEEVVFTASKYGKPLYRCAKASRWGDRLPIQHNPEFQKSENAIEQECDDVIPENEEQQSNSEYETKEEKNTFVSEAPFSTIKDEKV